jgi:hypothetical protein
MFRTLRLLGIAVMLGMASALILPLYGQTLKATGTARVGALYSDRQPLWTRGALVSVESNKTRVPVIHAFDDAGRELSPIAFTIPGATLIQVLGVSRGSDGAAGLVGRAFNRDSREGGFISWISPDHQTVKTIQPAPYMPFLVTIAPDGTIWTLGTELVNEVENDPGVNPAHGVIRQFSTNGTQLSSFLPRSDVFGGKWLGLPNGFLVSNKERVGWYARSAQEYLEMTFDGKVTRFSGFAPPKSTLYITGLAITDDNEVFASALQSGRAVHKTGLYRLDRGSGTWIPLVPPPGTEGASILGSDANRLVLRGTDTSTYELKFFTFSAMQ